jgi:hypothetical protein
MAFLVEGTRLMSADWQLAANVGSPGRHGAGLGMEGNNQDGTPVGFNLTIPLIYE